MGHYGCITSVGYSSAEVQSVGQGVLYLFINLWFNYGRMIVSFFKWLNKKTTTRQTRRTTVRHLCPVCSNVAGRGTFLCLGCSPSRWIHYECGDYSSTEVKSNKTMIFHCENIAPYLTPVSKFSKSDVKIGFLVQKYLSVPNFRSRHWISEILWHFSYYFDDFSLWEHCTVSHASFKIFKIWCQNQVSRPKILLGAKF